MKNFELLLIRSFGDCEPDPLPDFGGYPRVGRVYGSPLLDCAATAALIYPGFPVHTAATLRVRDAGESNEDFALRCLAGLDFVFTDLSRSGNSRAALVFDDEIIVTLMAGCGYPKFEPTELIPQPGEGWLIRMNAFLWQRGYSFEIAGKLSL